MKWLGLMMLFGAFFLAAGHYNKKFVDWLRFQSIGTRDYIVDRLNLMFIDIPPNTVLMWQFLLSFGLGALVFILILPHWLPAFFFGAIVTAVGWKIPKPIVDFMYKKRVEKFVLQMVDALSLMSNGMKSGMSIPQALGMVVAECPNPIRQEFEYILSQNRLGVSLEEAFVKLSERIRSDDVEMFVTATNILKETGGNLAETFDTIVSTIRDRIKVEKKISTITAQGLYQSIFVGAMPTALGVAFYLTDPEFMQPLFTTAPGLAMCLVILALQAAGIFIALRIVRVEV